MNKDIESLVDKTICAVHLHKDEMYISVDSLGEPSKEISEPGMVIDSITGDLFGLIGQTICAVHRIEDARVYIDSPPARGVTYTIDPMYRANVRIAFKDCVLSADKSLKNIGAPLNNNYTSEPLSND